MSNRLLMQKGGPVLPQRVPGPPELLLRKRQAFGLLDLVCQQLEPTDTQMARAESAYSAIGEWLAEDPLLADAIIYVQGSIAHGTACKPIGRMEHDVDLICFVPGYTPDMPPAALKKIIGDRLKAHETYREMLQEMPRCWRLNYANDFHLDITVSIANPWCANGGELVPDRKLKAWKESNPKGFRALFARRADLVPIVKRRAMAGGTFAMDKADVEAFPARSSRKGILRRSVQLSKRHRDIDFLRGDPELLPISIIITALESQAYEWCVRNEAYDNEFDLLCDTIRIMPWFIETEIYNGEKHWMVWNETTEGENFAEKWNLDRRRARSFYEWHGRALADFTTVADAVGLDQVAKRLSAMLGERPVNQAMDAWSGDVTDARKSSRLFVAPTVGLTASISAGTAVRANTFYGR